MPDIEMCLTKTCQSVDKCYRAQAPWGTRQAVRPREPKENEIKCDEFIVMRGKNDGSTKEDTESI